MAIREKLEAPCSESGFDWLALGITDLQEKYEGHVTRLNDIDRDIKFIRREVSLSRQLLTSGLAFIAILITIIGLLPLFQK